MKCGNFSKTILLGILLMMSLGFAQSIDTTDNQVHDTSYLNLDQTDTTIENIRINPLEPTVNENITVQADIDDQDTLTEALLFWKYDSFNTTYSSTTMTKSDNLIVPEESFLTSSIAGVLLETGNIGAGSYGNYTLDNRIISSISLSLDRGSASSDMVYYKIQIKNSTTNDWEIVAEAGSSEGTDPLPTTYSYTLDESIEGINIYAESDKNDKPPLLDLSLTDLASAGILHTAEIQGIPEPSFVSYYIQAKDSLNNITQSEIFNFLIDSKPVLSSYSIPTLVTPKNNTIPVNVTVSDPDGYQTITSGGVVFSYKLVGEEIWASSNLVFSRNISLTESIYTGIIPYNPSTPLESLLRIQINVTDSVGGKAGYTVTTTDSIIVDFKGPTLTLVEIINAPDNTTSIYDPVVMEAVFSDISGISNVSIFYRITNASQYIEVPMLNMSDISIADLIVRFNISLPAANEDTFVYYYFETMDFLNNTNVTPPNYYYADGLGPIIYDDNIIYKSVIANTTDASIVFNATDVSGIDVAMSRVFYSYNDDSVWYDTPISEIDYASIINYQEVFSLTNLPVFINDADYTYLSVEVDRKSRIQQALLKIEFTHELSADLRMWLQTQNGEILIFDRLADQNSINIDLLQLDFVESDFDNSNFTLKIQDFSDEFLGTIDVFQIELINYELPFPYQYTANIAKANNDTEVQFYIGMYDNFGNILNSSIQSYYSDGLVPDISLVAIPSILDMNGDQTIEIEAIVTDNGGIQNVELYYQISNSSWIIKEMSYDSVSTHYKYEITPESSSGDVSYYIRAYDQVGYQLSSNISSFDFLNGLGPVISVYGDPFGIDPIDMNEAGIIPIMANVSDNGNIISVNLFYRFDIEDDWSNVTMLLVNDSSTYLAEIELPSTDGKVFFKIQAIDDEDIINETEEFVILYENAASSLGSILLWGGGIIGAGAIAFFLFKFFTGGGTGKIASFVKSKRPS